MIEVEKSTRGYYKFNLEGLSLTSKHIATESKKHFTIAVAEKLLSFNNLV